MTTSRDEVLARVAARGSRLRRVRHAVAGFAAVGATGIGVLGLGLLGPSALPADSDRPDGTEQVATVGTDAPGRAGTPLAPPVDGTPGGTTPGTTGGSDTPATDPGRPGSGSTGSGTPGSTTPTSRPGTTTSTVPPRTTTSTPPRDGVPVPPTTTTTTTPDTVPLEPGPEPPAVLRIRMSSDQLVELSSGDCDGDTSVTVAVEILDATEAFLSWNFGTGKGVAPMWFDGTHWTAEIGPFGPDTVSGPTPVAVVVSATGPGGTSEMAHTISLDDCTPD